METNSSYQDKRYIYNPKPEILDEFWSDCIEPKKKKQSNNQNFNKNKKNTKIQKSRYRNDDSFYQNKKFNPSDRSSENSYIYKKSSNKAYNSDKLFNPKNRSANNSQSDFNNNNKSTEKYLENIYNKHPSFVEEMKEQELKKIKSKNAILRCKRLYEYGLELEKEKKMNKKKNDYKKIKDDISLCTFKPKINKKVSYLDENKIYEDQYNRLYQNNKKIQKQKNKSVDYLHTNKNNDNFENFDFKPQINDPNVVEKIFRNRKGRAKTISDEKENAEFILRYTKARDEYLIKRFKKMSRKDDNYDYSLLSLTKRLCNKQYKNYLNVNNTIFLFGEPISPNNYINNSIADFRGISASNSIPNQKKEEKDDYIIELRKNLLSFDLSENEEEN